MYRPGHPPGNLCGPAVILAPLQVGPYPGDSGAAVVFFDVGVILAGWIVRGDARKMLGPNGSEPAVAMRPVRRARARPAPGRRQG
jgi:hypothetical protein